MNNPYLNWIVQQEMDAKINGFSLADNPWKTNVLRDLWIQGYMLA